MKSKKQRILASATVMSLVLTSTLTATTAKAAEVNRLKGVNRELTAVDVAKKVFQKAENVIIVNGYGYADAVSATPLAKALNAPILLTNQTGDSVDVQALKDLGAKNVYIVGGDFVVKDSLKTKLAENYKVERICGAKEDGRYGTNAAVAKRVIEKTGAKKAILVSAEGYADALSVASIAAAQGMPVLFANKNEVPTVVKNVANGLTVQAVGGTGVLPDSVLKLVNAERITKNAKDRFETNLEVLEYFKEQLKDVKKVYMAAGGQKADQFADALVASAAAAKDGAPVVLTGIGANAEQKAAANKYVADNMDKDTVVNVVGGTASVADDDVKAVEDKVKEVKVEEDAEKAVKAYEDAKIETAEEITAAKALKAEADKAVEAVKDAAKKEAFQTKIAAKDKLVEEAEAKLGVRVQSVSAINAKEIQVKFNNKVTETTAEDLDNYLVRRTGDANPVDLTSLGNVSATLQEDEKTVIITSTNNTDIEAVLGVQAEAVFEFIVENVKDVNGKVAPKFTQTLKIKDTVAPKFVSAESSARTTTTSITVKFSEPVVVTSGVAKVNGVIATVTPGTNQSEITVTTAANLVPGNTYNLELLNFVDFAGNFLAPNPVNTTVTVKADTIAPNITDVKVVRDNLIEVTFDKAMNPATLTKASNNVRLLDGNFTNINANNVATITPKLNTSNRVFQIALQSVSPNEIPFNAQGMFNASIVFTDDVADSLGNKMNTVTKAITIKKDEVKPSVTTVSFKKADASATYGGVALTNGAIVVKFDESIAKTAGIDATDVKLIDNNGADVTSTYVTNSEMTNSVVNPDDATELIIPLKALIVTGDNISSLTLRLPKDKVEDLSLAKNKNNASVNTFNVEAERGAVADIVKPVVNSATGQANNQIDVSVTEQNLDNSSALNLNNYRLDGKPLPAGTYVTVTGVAPNMVIHLHLPAGSISETRNYALNVSNIKDKAGNTSALFAANNVALVDDVKPEFKTATLNTDGSVSLGFSEDVTGLTAADLIVTFNNTVLKDGTAGTTAPYKVTKITTGAEAGKWALELNTREFGIAAVGGTVTAPTGTYTGSGTNVMKFVYVDLDGNGALSAGDLVLSAVDTGVATPISDAVAGTYNLNNATSLKVKTIASPTGAQDAATNKLVGNKEIVVK